MLRTGALAGLAEAISAVFTLGCSALRDNDAFDWGRDAITFDVCVGKRCRSSDRREQKGDCEQESYNVSFHLLTVSHLSNKHSLQLSADFL